MSTLFALLRAAHYASLMATFGAHALLALGRPLGANDARLRGLLRSCAETALLTAVLWVPFVAASMTGTSVLAVDGATLSATVLTTRFGQVFLARAGFLAVLLLLGMRSGNHTLKAVVAGAALALLSATGHAAVEGAIGGYGLRAANDALHLLTAGFWTGGLVVLASETLPRIADKARLIALLHCFSRWGALGVAILLASGTLNAVFILDMPGMPWSGTYVALLAAKIVLAFVMVALALTNRFGVVPGLERGEAEAAETIPITLLAELGAAVIILLLVGFLGLTAPMQM